MPDLFGNLGDSEPYVPNYLQDEIQFRIDNDLRTIAIPADGVVLGVVGDKNVNHVNFQMPAWYNGFDMSEFQARINFVDPEGNANYYTVNDMTVYDPEGNEVTGTPGENDTLYFTWLVDSYATQYAGTVQFSVRLFKLDNSDGVSRLVQAFNTQINACNVLSTIQLAEYVTQEQAEDILYHYMNELGDVTEELKADIEAKAAATIESIPDDYTTVTNNVTRIDNDLNNFYADTNIKTYYTNLFDINDPDFLDNTTLNDNGTTSTNTMHTVTGYIPVEINRPLYPSYDGSSHTVLHLCEYNASKTFIRHSTYFGAGKVITDSNTKYIRCVAPKDYGNIQKFQIQYDRTTAFVEHKKSFINLANKTLSDDIDLTNDNLDKFVEDSGMEKKVSRNLFDINSSDTLINQTISQAGVIAANANHIVSPYIPVELNRSLQPSYNGVGHTVLNLCEYDENKQFLQGSQYFSNGKTITNTNTRYIRFAIPKDYGDYTKFQLEYDKVTPFVRYGTIYEKKVTETVISVKTNGTGDFTTIRDAIEYANTHAPCSIMLDSDTTYTIDFTDTEIDNAGYPNGFYGVEVKSNVHIIGNANKNVINTGTVIKASISTTISSTKRDAISTLNLNGNNIIIENVRIEAENIRYAVHDDYSGNANAYHCFNNCEIVSINGTNGAAYGAGSRTGQVTDIINCVIAPHLVWHTASEGYYRKSVFNIENSVINGFLFVADYNNGGKLCELTLKNVKYTSLNYERKGIHTQQIAVNGINNAISPIKYNSDDFVFNTDEVKTCLADVDIDAGQAVKLTGAHTVGIAENDNVFYGVALENASSGDFVKIQTSGYVNTLKCGLSASAGDKIGVNNGTIAVTDEAGIGTMAFVDTVSGYFVIK